MVKNRLSCFFTHLVLVIFPTIDVVMQYLLSLSVYYLQQWRRLCHGYSAIIVSSSVCNVTEMIVDGPRPNCRSRSSLGRMNQFDFECSCPLTPLDLESPSSAQ